MTFRGSHRWFVICATAGIAAMAAPLRAQVPKPAKPDSTVPRTTSDRRIPVQKRSSGGEVALPTAAEQARLDSIARADSLKRIDEARTDSIERVERARQDSLAAVARARQDSLEAMEHARQDSIAAVEKARTDSIARADSIAQAERMRREQMRSRGMFGGSGWYIGLAGGASAPTGDLKTIGYTTGYQVAVPIGWQSQNKVLGARVDLGYSQFNGGSYAVVPTAGSPALLVNEDPKIYSAVLNATLRFPLNASHSTGFYLLGGGGVYSFRNFGMGSALSSYLGNDVTNPLTADNKTSITKWGVDGGAGLDFGIGAASLYVESRLVNVYANRNNPTADAMLGTTNDQLRWVPIVLGVKFR